MEVSTLKSVIEGYLGYRPRFPSPTVCSLRPVPSRVRLHSLLPQVVHVISVRATQLLLGQRLRHSLHPNPVSGLLCCTVRVPI